MNVLITDVTEMHRNNFCVAGWDRAAERMVRPLPDGRNWSEALLNRHGVVPGTQVRFVPQRRPTGPLPHHTEDWHVDGARISVSGERFVDWVGPLAPPVEDSLESAFANQLQWNSVWNRRRKGVYVPLSTQCRSLVALRLASGSFSLVEEFEKLRAIVNDGEASYDLPVTSALLKNAWRETGLAGARARIPDRRYLHLRVGLARPWEAHPEKCYLMINGAL